MAVTAGIAGATAAAGAFVAEGIRMSTTLEQLRVNLDVMTGSSETGGALLGQMTTLAKETPFSLEDVATAGKVLLALGSSAGDVTRQIKMLGDVAAGTSQPVNQLAQVFGEVQQAGRLTSNELLQFSRRGIPLLDELSESLGKTKVELREMVEDGAITADMVEDAFERMTSAGGRFADLMGKQAETLAGKWEKFKDSLSLGAAGAMGDPGTSGTVANFLKNSLDEASNFIDRGVQGAKLFQQEGLSGMTAAGAARFAGSEARRMAADAAALAGPGKGELTGPTAAEIEAAEAQDKLNESMQTFIDRLQLQADTYGMTSDAAQLYEMRLKGANQADLEYAQVLIDKKTRLDEATKLEKESARAEKEQAADLKRLSDSIKTPAQEFMDDFDRILGVAGTKAGAEAPDVIRGGLEDLAEQIRAKLGTEGPANQQSTAAIRAGSIEALRAQFPGGQVAAKQLKEAEKQTKEQESMHGLLETIADKIQGLGDGATL